jgi:hypothetical protein
MLRSVGLGVRYGACAAFLFISTALPANAEIIQTSSGQCFEVVRASDGTIFSSRPVSCTSTNNNFPGLPPSVNDKAAFAAWSKQMQEFNQQENMRDVNERLEQRARDNQERRILADMSKMAAVINIINDQGGFTTQSGGAPGASHLGMYISPNSGGSFSAIAGGGGASIRSSGFGVSDTAGLFPAGSITGSSRDTVGGGGAGLTYDVSGPGAQHRMTFGASFDYARHDMNFGTPSVLAAAGVAASVRATQDTYNLHGQAAYSFGQSYLVASGRWSFRNGNETLSLDASTGSFSGDGFGGDLTAGHVFALYSTVTTAPPARGLPTKAPPKPTDGMFVGLALSGHVGYVSDTDDGFVDSAGFIYGKSRVHFGTTGAQAKLIAAIADNRTVWMPYLAVAGDRRFSYTSTLDLPTQAALPGGDVISLHPALTFWSTQVGVDVFAANSLRLGVSGTYAASSDMHGIGGSAYARIPFAMIR